MKNKLLIYELNELPKQILDLYIRKYPKSNFAILKKKSLYLDTFTTDKGELHPWTTWPTFYRGIDNRKHKIQFINQEINIKSKYPPVWEFLIKKNLKIGIFGSLQSYPPLINKNVCFFLPDTFSPGNETYPKNLSAFQKFNLTITSNNSGTSRNIRIKDFYNLINCLFFSKFRIKTFLILFLQVFSEIVYPKFKRRRSLLQPILGFDVFYKYLNETKPDFSTFFSNHLAGMMHRYWFDLFPEEFANPIRNRSVFNANSIIEAMHIADKQIGQLIKFCDNNSYDLWIGGSMGQKSIKRELKQKLFIKDYENFISKIGLGINKYKILPSMYPDINIQCKNKNDLDLLLKIFLRIKSSKNTKIFSLRYAPVNNIVNFTINEQPKNIKVLLDNKKLNLSELGISLMPEEIGTGYHIPEGVLLAYGNKSKSLLKKYKKINTKLICPIILNFFKINKEKYMLKLQK